MNSWQYLIVLIYGFINFLSALIGFYQSKYRKNAFGNTRYLYPFGVFVWGDAVIICAFWALSSLTALLLNDLILFLLIISTFWLTRSVGETMYWIAQQFSTLPKNPPKRLMAHSVFHNDSIWFIYQISWQSLTVITLISTIYLTHLWLK
jgi:hypothetical protein